MVKVRIIATELVVVFNTRAKFEEWLSYANNDMSLEYEII